MEIVSLVRMSLGVKGGWGLERLCSEGLLVSFGARYRI
jgi:hypothetical protein